MNTERIDLKNGDYTENINRAAKLLKNGGIVAIPTETVYGLAASACDVNAINNVFAAKGRPQDNPLIVHICDTVMLNDVATDIPKEAYVCAEKFWPGPFTMILKRSENIPAAVSAGLDTVAVRLPANRVACDIIKLAGPLAAPSANKSGSPSPTSAYHVLDDLDGLVDAVVLSDECAVGVESTVITLATTPPRLLRPGAVTAEELREIFPDIVVDKAVLESPEAGEKVASPGMKYKHYAPKTETYLVEGTSERFCEFINREENCLAVCFDEETQFIKRPKISYGSKFNEETLAHSVFDVLRSVDDMGLSKVYIHAPSKTGIGLAVYNRLIRAAAFRVMKL